MGHDYGFWFVLDNFIALLRYALLYAAIRLAYHTNKLLYRATFLSKNCIAIVA